MPSATYASGSLKRKKADRQKKLDQKNRKKIKSMDQFVTKTSPVEREVKLLLDDLVQRVEKCLTAEQLAQETAKLVEADSQYPEIEMNVAQNLINYSNDPALWPTVNESLRNYWVAKGGPDQNITQRTSFKDTKLIVGKYLTLYRIYSNTSPVSNRSLYLARDRKIEAPGLILE